MSGWVLEVVVEGLPFVFDDFLDVALFGVVHFDFFDAVVGAQVTLEVVGEEINQLP